MGLDRFADEQDERWAGGRPSGVNPRDVANSVETRAAMSKKSAFCKQLCIAGLELAGF